jgi:hypothetical protein
MINIKSIIEYYWNIDDKNIYWNNYNRYRFDYLSRLESNIHLYFKIIDKNLRRELTKIFNNQDLYI